MEKQERFVPQKLLNYIATIVYFTAQILYASSQLPPSIDIQPKQNLYFESDVTEISLVCSASGDPSPEYQWTKNDQIMSGTEDRITLHSNGTLHIAVCQSSDEAYYQCTATNTHGRALSSVTFLQRISFYYGTQPQETFNIEAGSHAVMSCAGVESVPNAEFSWGMSTSIESSPNVDLQQSERITIDQNEGTLYFANVIAGDETVGTFYSCVAKNNLLRGLNQAGNYKTLTVNSESSPAVGSPSRLYPAQDRTTVVGLYGEKLTIKCFFAGNPTPRITWSAFSNDGRITKANYDTELVFSSVKWEDEQCYTCHGTNTYGDTTSEICVDVQSKPIPEHLPINKNVTVNNDASFQCQTTSEPLSDITWYFNGEAININDPGYRRNISPDRMVLTISSVCKECVGETRASDNGVYSCNSSNIHGYDYGAGYLSILEATTITTKPISVIIEDRSKMKTASFYCLASTDPITDLYQFWSHDGNPLYPDDQPRYSVDQFNTLTVNLTDASDIVLSDLIGTYTCTASNGYSMEEASASLSVLGFSPVTSASVGDYWYIFVILVLLLLIIILVLFCIKYQKNNKGEDYFVDEYERKTGNDPIKELQEMEIQPYTRPIESDIPSIQPRRASLASTTRIESDDDDASMAEYAGVKATNNFDEQGSFIKGYTSNQSEI